LDSISFGVPHWADWQEKTRAISPREKMPFEVTPIIPYLTRYSAAAAVESPSNSAIAKNQ